MFGEIAYLIEGYQSTIYFLLFVIGFNPCNIYALFYGAPVYGNISISPELGNWVGDFVRLLMFGLFSGGTSNFYALFNGVVCDF